MSNDPEPVLRMCFQGIPILTFGLGTWQVFRWRWKLNLIQRLEERTSAEPISLPEDMSNIEELEYRRIKVKGRFDHSNEMFLAPRSLVIKGTADHGGGLISAGNRAAIGSWVVTPFELSDRKGVRILINRGWIPREKLNPKNRPEGQVSEEMEIIGILRNSEKRPPFGAKNDDNKNQWNHRDLQGMAGKLGTLAVFLDADSDSTIPGGPIGGQTRVTLRNEHLSYVVTWYGLSGFTTYLWWLKFIKKFTIV